MTITAKQQLLIEDFIKTAKLNGADTIDAALPLKHPLMVSGKGVQMRHIRKVKQILSGYIDELGHSVVLTVEGIVKQY